MRRRAELTAAVVVVMLAISGCGGGDDNGAGGGGTATASSVRTPAAQPGGLNQVPALYRKLEPSVAAVFVRTPQEADEGSGVVWKDHIVVTNAHVVSDADEATVVFADGDRRRAKVRARDVRTDLAVLEVPGKALPPATFADAIPAPGSLAVALGSPLGFEGSVTAGVISGVDRAIPSGGRTPSLVGLLQTDAAISPGNSGGALVGADGKVIGINVAYIPPAEHAVSIGFAIPATTVRDVVTQLLQTGHVEHPYLGTQLLPVGGAMAQRLQVDDGGALVTAVDKGGPADDGGIRPGDVIVKLAGRDVQAIEDVYSALREHKPGDTIEATVVRDGRRRELTVRLGDRPQGPG
jgi:S1-C subfamily serine protease